MPSTVVHTYIGLDTLNKLNSKPKKIINNNVDNYKIYCQCTDILYFYHIFLLFPNKVQNLGHEFHNKDVFNTFNLLINKNKSNKDKELFTFISGLITHYIADSHIHPYINHLESISSNTHFITEAYLDNYFIKTRMKIDPKKYDNTKFIFNYTEKNIIKECINEIFNKYFNYPNMGKKYYHALKEMKLFFKLARYDKYGIKRKIYKFIDLNPFKKLHRIEYISYHFDTNRDNEFLNYNHDTWYNLDNRKITSSKSFSELYQEVIDVASDIINKLYDYIFENKDINIKELIKNNSYANGLPISPNKKTL